MLGRIYKKYTTYRQNRREQRDIKAYFKGGSKPWSQGYLLNRNTFIKEQIVCPETLEVLQSGKLPVGYGSGFDERVVEYPWVISQIEKTDKVILDAGSTFNYDFVLKGLDLEVKELSILTYAPESQNYNEKRISYLYADLRDMPFRDGHFDLVISMSTIEHIDMDNSIYGYDLPQSVKAGEKSIEYLKAISEMLRVLKSKGKLLITVPFGIHEHHGFFQQFDIDMITKAKDLLEASGRFEVTYFRYINAQWEISNCEDCNESISYNPHTGAGKGDDGAAHSRSIACISFYKN
jgi:SAM-dependent methyltransferase